jgi:hypothetical protein
MSAAMESVIELHQVFKTYHLGEHVIPALQGVDLAVQRTLLRRDAQGFVFQASTWCR